MKLVEVRETAAYLGACEDFEDEPDAERALLDRFFNSLQMPHLMAKELLCADTDKTKRSI